MVASEQVLVTGQQLDTLCINTIRTLAIDAVQQANSGHPGAPMGLAPVTYCLWQEFLRYDPADPTWLNRDRFVLSNGHASMLALRHAAPRRGAAGRCARPDFEGTLRSDGRDQALPAAGQPDPGTSRIAPHVREWKPRPGRSARAWATAWAWPSPANGRRRTSTVPASRSSTTTSTRCAPTAI